MMRKQGRFHPLPAKLSYSNFYTLKVVSSHHDLQFEVGENDLYMFI